MPIKKSSMVGGRYNIIDELSQADAHRLASTKNLREVHLSGKEPAETWSRINDTILAERPGTSVFVHGRAFGTRLRCNLKFLKLIPDVQALAIVGFITHAGIKNFAHLSSLRSLTIGIHELDSLAFLEDISDGLTSLTLHTTKSKKPDLRVLTRFQKLKDVYVEGHSKNIDALGEIPSIDDLTLRSVTTKSLAFLQDLPKLLSLDIKLGATKDLSGIAGIDNLRYLELWQIRGLDDISVISTLTGLQRLFLETLNKVTTIPDLSALGKLRRIGLSTMDGLTDISGVFTAPALQVFIRGLDITLSPKDYTPLAKMKTLKRAAVTFTNDQTTLAFNQLMMDLGRSELTGNIPSFKFK